MMSRNPNGNSPTPKAGHRVLVEEIPSLKKSVRLEGAEAHHLIRVMRKEAGDVIEAMDGKGGAARCKILRVIRDDASLPGAVSVELGFEQALLADESLSKVKITLYMGILKAEAMEWVIEKAVELGVNSVVPLVLDHAVVKVESKGPQTFRDRWQRLADQALKQCGRKFALEVQLPASLSQVKKQLSPGEVYFFDEAADPQVPHFFSETLSWLAADVTHRPGKVGLLIGPEGGWSGRERQELLVLSKRVHLGRDRVLRAETAAIQAMSISTAARDQLESVNDTHFRTQQP